MDRRRRQTRTRSLAAIIAVGVMLLAGCSSDAAGGDRDRAEGATTSASTTTTERPRPTCDQGATVDQVAATPVDGTPSDHTVTSFDGTEIRIHWFPTANATAEEPAPTILMGPGWSLAGETSTEGSPLFGALGIGEMNGAGYNVLTWDPRGFGASTGSAQVNDPEHEGRDLQLLLDWVAEQPEAATDRDGDPRAGMVGHSYGGGIQLTLAGIDCRVDAIVPGLAWHSLETSLYKAETVKTGWAGVLIDAAASGQVDPHTVSAYESGVDSGTLSDEDREWFLARGPAELVDDIQIPTLLVQGTVDTLFTLDEAITNYRSLEERGVPVAMLWFCGGHGTCRTEEGDLDHVGARTMAWLDHYLKGDSAVEVGPALEVIDQDGTWWEAASYPPEAGDFLTATGRGTLTLNEGGGAELGGSPPADGGILDDLVWSITPGPASHSVEVPVDPPSKDTMVLGAPSLRLTYRGTSPPGERPTRVFAQLVDEDRGVVVGNQITPIEVQLDGAEHTVEVELEVVAQRLRAGDRLTLQLVATTTAYATPRLGGEVAFERIELSLPTAVDLREAAPAASGAGRAPQRPT